MIFAVSVEYELEILRKRCHQFQCLSHISHLSAAAANSAYIRKTTNLIKIKQIA